MRLHRLPMKQYAVLTQAHFSIQGANILHIHTCASGSTASRWTGDQPSTDTYGTYLSLYEAARALPIFTPGSAINWCTVHGTYSNRMFQKVLPKFMQLDLPFTYVYSIYPNVKIRKFLPCLPPDPLSTDVYSTYPIGTFWKVPLNTYVLSSANPATWPTLPLYNLSTVHQGRPSIIPGIAVFWTSFFQAMTRVQFLFTLIFPSQQIGTYRRIRWYLTFMRTEINQASSLLQEAYC